MVFPIGPKVKIGSSEIPSFASGIGGRAIIADVFPLLLAPTNKGSFLCQINTHREQFAENSAIFDEGQFSKFLSTPSSLSGARWRRGGKLCYKTQSLDRRWLASSRASTRWTGKAFDIRIAVFIGNPAIYLTHTGHNGLWFDQLFKTGTGAACTACLGQAIETALPALMQRSGGLNRIR